MARIGLIDDQTQTQRYDGYDNPAYATPASPPPAAPAAPSTPDYNYLSSSSLYSPYSAQAAPAPDPTAGQTPAQQRAAATQPPAYSPDFQAQIDAATNPAIRPPAGYPSWAWTPSGQQTFTQLKTAFPQMSDEEVWAHLNYSQRPDAQFMNAIIANLHQNYRPPAAAPPAGPTGPGPTGPGPGDGTNTTPFSGGEAEFVARFGRPGTPAELVAMEAQLNAAGITIARNAAGTAGKIRLPDGRIIDVILGAEGGGRGFWWGEGGGSDAGGGGPMSVDSALLAPWTGKFTPPTQDANLPTMPLPDLPNWRVPGQPGSDAPGTGDWVAPPAFTATLDLPSYQKPADFKAPDAQSVLLDPGYQLRVDEANRAFINSAAANAVLGSGGTLTDFLKYNQNLASQEYGNAYQRAASDYDRNFQGSLADYNNRVNEATQEYNARVAEYNQNYGNQFAGYQSALKVAEDRYAPLLAQWQTQASDLRHQQELEYNRAWQQYQNDMNVFYANQQHIYDRLYGPAALGAGAIQ